MADKRIKIVTTVSGEDLPRNKCRLIRGKYYKTGRINVYQSGDCFRITDSRGITRFRTLETGAVVWDNLNKKYIHKSMLGTAEGIIDSKGTIGSFSSSSDNVKVILPSGNSTLCINSELAEENGYKERVADGYYYKISEHSSIFFTQKIIPSSNYKVSLDYGCENVMKIYQKSYSNYTIPTKKEPFIEDIYKNANYIFDKYTFGVEFETIKGKIPDHICNKLGLMPLRDGSIAGIEYATVPLTGLKGLYTLLEVYREIQHKTDYDFNCSMHIHVGGFKRDEESIVSLFKTMYMMQNDMYDYFPMYKFKNLGIKRKNYTSPLPNRLSSKMNYENLNMATIKEDMSKLTHYLSGEAYGYDSIDLKDIEGHPNNPGNDRKWGMRARYLWFNLIPVVFTNKKTAEFRIFGMPNTEIKLFSFLLMSLSLVHFSTNNKKIILENPDAIKDYNVITIVNSIFRNDKINRYLQKRKIYVRDLTRKKGANYTEKDII